MTSVYELASRIEDLAERMGDVKIQDASAYDRVLQLFFSRARRTFKGIRVLTNEKLGEPALMLVRPLYEDTLNLLYIGTDPDRLAQLYLDYAYIRNYKYLKFVESVDPDALRDEDRATITDVEERYRALKERYPMANSWSGLSITDTARKVHMDEAHRTIYKVACDVTHGNISGVYNLLLAEDNRSIGVEDDSPDELADTALVLGLACFRTILGEVDRHFGLQRAADLRQLGEDLSSIIRTTPWPEVSGKQEPVKAFQLQQ